MPSEPDTDGTDRSEAPLSHVHTDDPWCDWCDEPFEEGDEAVMLTWEFPSCDIAVTFCSDKCATEWDCSKSRKDREEVVLHV